MQDWLLMRTSVASLAMVLGLLLTVGAFALAPPTSAQNIDTQVPPGNPVIGDDRPGDIEGSGEPNYALWVLVAGCLIGAGVLLIKIERWEARRIEHQAPSTSA